ncbi:MAG TPA: hypothetical protein VMV89_00125 [Candidatus Paceibacterota bacterium]|nr:hypothetical protein [Candidatus Paceibacterota bacterium]
MISWFKPSNDTVAVYCKVFPHNNFGESAQFLFEAMREAQEFYPNKRRLLYLEIKGHRNNRDEFDADMFELQKDFLLGFLAPFVTEIHGPLVSVRNSNPQENDFPPALTVQNVRNN